MIKDYFEFKVVASRVVRFSEKQMADFLAKMPTATPSEVAEIQALHHTWAVYHDEVYGGNLGEACKHGYLALKNVKPEIGNDQELVDFASDQGVTFKWLEIFYKNGGKTFYKQGKLTYNGVPA